MRRSIYRLFGRLPKPLRRMVVRLATPTWTAGVVAILEREDGRWLLVRPVYRRGWTLPGGLLDRGEDPGTAVVREFDEELGLPIRVVGEPWVVYDSAMRRIDAVFRAEALGTFDPDGVAIRTPELEGVGWFDPVAPPPTEDETDDVLALAIQVASGGSRILWR